MSHDDAATNSARAEEIRTFVALHRASACSTNKIYTATGYTDEHEGEQTATLTVDLLLAAANALEAQGVKGWAAARLQCKEIYGATEYADVALEAADTADDTIHFHVTRGLGPEEVHEALDELREQE